MRSEIIKNDIINILKTKDKDAFYNYKPMARLWIRFNDFSTKDLNKKLWNILQTYIDIVDNKPLWYLSHSIIDGKYKSINTGKPYLKQKNKIKKLLESFHTLPKSRFDNRLLGFSIQDGLCPSYATESGNNIWHKGCLLPENFEFSLTINDPDNYEPSGHLEIYFPLEHLENKVKISKWVNFGKKTFTMLKGAIGGINPVLKALSRNNLPSNFYTKYPHFQIPVLFKERTFYVETFKPSIFETPVTPNWITFLRPDLLKINPEKIEIDTFKNGILLKVSDNPIIKIDEIAYQLYKNVWDELSFFHLEYWEPNDVLDTYKFQLELFNSKSLSQLEIEYNSKIERVKKCKAYYLKSYHLLRDENHIEALVYSEKAILLFNSPKIYPVAIQSLLNLVKKDATNQKIIFKWEKRILNESEISNDVSFKMLQIWILINNIESALFWFKKIINTQDYVNQIETEDFYALLRATETYKQLFKPLQLPDTSVFAIPKGAEKQFPKFCKRLEMKSKYIHYLNKGVSNTDINSAEKTLKRKFNLDFKKFLSFWNGGVIATKVSIFSISQVLEKSIKENIIEENIIIGKIGNGFTISTYNNSIYITQDGRIIRSSKNLDNLLEFCMKNNL